MAAYAVEPAPYDTGAHSPAREGVVLAEVASISGEVGVLERRKVEVIEIRITRPECISQRTHFRMARGAHGIHLPAGES